MFTGTRTKNFILGALRDWVGLGLVLSTPMILCGCNSTGKVIPDFFPSLLTRWKPKNLNDGVAIFQAPALPFAESRQMIVQSCRLTLGKPGEYTFPCTYGLLRQVFSGMDDPVYLALIRSLNSYGSS